MCYLPYFSMITTHTCASHIGTTTLADGMNKMVPESESEQHKANINLTEIVEDPDQSSEEPKASSA